MNRKVILSVVASIIVLLVESLCIALGVTFFIYLSDTIINASVRKLLKTKK